MSGFEPMVPNKKSETQHKAVLEEQQFGKYGESNFGSLDQNKGLFNQPVLNKFTVFHWDPDGINRAAFYGENRD